MTKGCSTAATSFAMYKRQLADGAKRSLMPQSSLPHIPEMSSISGSGECASLAYLGGGLDILNLNTTHCFDPPDAQGDDSACSMYWFSNASDVRSLAAPSFEHSDIIWRFRNASDLLGDLPLSKPLVIDCPMPLCVFPISGPFSELQRYLLYLNFLVALLAIPLRLIRDISQLFLVSNGVAAFIYFLKIYALHNRPIVDLDFLPTMVYTATGLLVSLIWCSLRAPGKIKTPAHMALYFMSPHLAAFFGIIGCMLTTAFYYSGWHPSAVVLESPASFRLTSPCYRESNGTISFWTVDFSYPIRRLDELQIVLPPDNRGSAASPWTAFPIPLTKLYSGFWAMLSAVVGTWIVQGLLYRAGIFTVNRNQ